MQRINDKTNTHSFNIREVVDDVFSIGVAKVWHTAWCGVFGYVAGGWTGAGASIVLHASERAAGYSGRTTFTMMEGAARAKLVWGFPGVIFGAICGIGIDKLPVRSQNQMLAAYKAAAVAKGILLVGGLLGYEGLPQGLPSMLFLGTIVIKCGIDLRSLNAMQYFLEERNR